MICMFTDSCHADDKAPRVHDFAPTTDDDDFLGRDHDHRANVHQSLQQQSNSINNDGATTSSSVAKAPSLHMLPNQSVDPLQLVKQLEFTAFKYIGAASALAFLLGKWGFSLLVAIPLISIPGVLYYIFGHQPNKDLNWNIEKQEGMKSVSTNLAIEVHGLITLRSCSSIQPKVKQWNGSTLCWRRSGGVSAKNSLRLSNRWWKTLFKA